MESQKQHPAHLQFGKNLYNSRCENNSFKFIHNEEDDSGYNSYHTVTANSSSILHHNISTLSPIVENQEVNSYHLATQTATTPSNINVHKKQKVQQVVTPTTQNIEGICSLHLTTPKDTSDNVNIKSITFTTPTNSVQPHAILETVETPSQSSTSLQNSLCANLTPRKVKKSIKRKSSGFREKLYGEENAFENSKRFYSDENIDTENGNCVTNSPMKLDDKHHLFSPIKKNHSVLRENVNIKNDFNITSSTPKNVAFQPKFYLERETNNSQGIIESGSAKKRSRFIKKYQSFSPNKLKTSRDFPITTINENLNSDKVVPIIQKRKIFVRQSALCLVNDSPDLVKHDEQDENIKAVVDDKFETSEDLFNLSTTGDVLDAANKISDGGINDLINGPIVMQINKSPSSTLLNSALNCYVATSSGYSISGAEIEKDQMLYPEIPRSPPKVIIKPKNVLKRLNSNRKGINKSISSSNRKLLCNPTRKCLAGTERVNIIKRLYKYPLILDTIFKLLKDADIFNLSFVSKFYSDIIQENKTLKERRLKYLANIIPMKENQNNSSIVQQNYFHKTKTDIININLKKNSDNIVRQPFHQFNRNSESDNHKSAADISPPVSPSSKKFKKHQKVVARLDKNSKLTLCPRCRSASLIIEVKNDIFPEKKFPLFRSNSAQASISYNDLLSSPLDEAKRFNFGLYTADALHPKSNHCRNLFNKDLIKSNSADATFLPSTSHIPTEYAICSKPICEFKFCIKCSCSFDVDHTCKEFSPNSPSKEDERCHIRTVIGSKQSKKALKRL